MDREILFRGKRIDTGEWVEGDLFQDKDFEITCITKWECSAKTSFRQWDPSKYLVDPETVGQYTGIYDKNGRRIFEGDIVTIPNSKKQGLPAVIRWSQSETRFEISRMGYQPLPLDPLFSRNGYYSRCEIVGNIHDNPELLEGGE